MIINIEEVYEAFIKTANVTDNVSVEAKLIIKESLERRMAIPLNNIRKIKKYDGYDMGSCPVCNTLLDNSFLDDLEYCYKCGQKIAFS